MHSSFSLSGLTSMFQWRTSRSQTTRGKSLKHFSVLEGTLQGHSKKFSFILSQHFDKHHVQLDKRCTDGFAERLCLLIFKGQGGRSKHSALPGQRGQIRRSDEPSGPPWRKRHAWEILPAAHRRWAQDPAGEVSWWTEELLLLTPLVYFWKHRNQVINP